VFLCTVEAEALAVQVTLPAAAVALTILPTQTVMPVPLAAWLLQAFKEMQWL